MKLKYTMIVFTLIVLTLGVGGCSVMFPWPPTISPPSSPNTSDEHTNPQWTFPSAGTGAPVALPDFPSVIAKIMPSVVTVSTKIVVSGFFGGQYTQSVAGSGAIIDASNGYVVTNNHVVQDAQQIQVGLHDGRVFTAQIVGTDALTDLAVLKIDAANLPYAPWGDSSQLRLGDWVIAIGNALGEGISASEGIVSRLNVAVTVDGNTLRGLIQTTAPINPGNSGGPLVDMAGEVIGITSVKIATIGVEGVGYAISTDGAEPVIEELIGKGRVIRPYLGVTLSTVDALVAASRNLSVSKGALIEEVFPNTPAEAAGLKNGDVIIRFGDKEITNVDDLVQAIRDSQVGQDVEIVFIRDKDTKTTSAKLEERQD
jgi:serine protease Do